MTVAARRGPGDPAPAARRRRIARPSSYFVPANLSSTGYRTSLREDAAMNSQ